MTELGGLIENDEPAGSVHYICGGDVRLFFGQAGRMGHRAPDERTGQNADISDGIVGVGTNAFTARRRNAAAGMA